MPRVENRGDNVNEWARTNRGEGSSTWDVCAFDYVDLLSDPHIYDEELVPYNGDPSGNLGRSGDCAHPDYGYDKYLCAVCGILLDEFHDGDGFEIAGRRRLIEQYDKLC